MARVGQTIQDGSVIWKVRDLRAVVTTSENGLMSAYDKQKLDSIEGYSNHYELPTASTDVLGGVLIGANISCTDGAISITKANISTALGYTPATPDLVTDSSDGLMSSEDKTKLDNIAENANNYSLPTASISTLGGVRIGSNVTVGDRGVISIAEASDSVYGVVKTGSNISNTNGVINITKDDVSSALGYTPPTQDTATQSSNGLMSMDDKIKLDSIGDIPEAYVLPNASSTELGGVRIGSNITNNDGTISINKTNISDALGYTPPTQDTTYINATSTVDGLMSKEDKSNLDKIVQYMISNNLIQF